MNDKGLSDRPGNRNRPCRQLPRQGRFFDYQTVRTVLSPLTADFSAAVLPIRLGRRSGEFRFVVSPGVTAGRPRAKTETEPPSGPESSPASRPPSVRPPPFRAATMRKTRGDGESTGRQIPTAPSPHSRRRNRAYRIFGLSPAHSAIGGITPMAITSSRSLAKWR